MYALCATLMSEIKRGVIMQFIIVEIKQKDLYTIYDVENKGVCCCSTYTLAQLQSAGHKITGFTVNSDGKYGVKECGLDGKPRTKKAPIICADETKRSAVTIAKGLDEKHYPRVKQERSGEAADKTVVTTAQTYNVVIAKNQVVPMRVGDIFKFGLQTERNEQLTEFVGVITDVHTYNAFGNQDDQRYVLSVVTKDGLSVANINANQVLFVNSCRLTPDVRNALNNVADAVLKHTELQKQYNQIREEQRQEERKIHDKYAPRYDKLNAKMQNQVQQKTSAMEKLMLLNGTIDGRYMQEYIKQHYAERLAYKICRRMYDDCGASDTGSFAVSVYYDRKKSAWRFGFYAKIEQRSSYMTLRSKPFFYEEYDGELIGLEDAELEKALGKLEYVRLKEQYEYTLTHSLKDGRFELAFDSSGESRKGYYAYIYEVVYEFKGKPTMELSKFKEITKKIFG